MKNINKKYLLLFFLFWSFLTHAEKLPEDVFKKGNELFQQKNYPEAIKYYTSILEKGYVSEDLYFNLGNAYYRSQDYAKAILNYERTLKLNPYHEDATLNLKLANLKTIDKIENPELPSILLFLKNIFLPSNSDTPSKILVASLFLMLAGYAGFKFIKVKGIKKISQVIYYSFLGFSIVCLVILLISIKTASKKFGIIMSSISYIKTSPEEEGKDAFYLHAGAKVEIIEDYDTKWKKIILNNEKRGFCKTEDLEGI